MNIQHIRDNLNDMILLQIYLNYIENDKSVGFYVENLLGTAIYHNNTHAIIKINAFIEEFNIIIDIWNILREIYNEEKKNTPSYGELISFHSFEHEKMRLYGQYKYYIT